MPAANSGPQAVQTAAGGPQRMAAASAGSRMVRTAGTGSQRVHAANSRPQAGPTARGGGHGAPSAPSEAALSSINAILRSLAAMDATWVKRHRTINTAALFAIIAAKRGRRDPVWKGQEYLDLLAGGYAPAAKVNPASISKALKRMPLGTFQRVHEHFTTELLSQPGAILHPPPHLRRLYAVDSTKVQLPPKMAQLGYRPMQPTGTTPILCLTTIIDIRTGILVAADYSPSLDERAGLIRLVARNTIPPDTILVADRGFYSKLVWETLTNNNIHPLFRCKCNADNTIHNAYKTQRKTLHTTLHNTNVVIHRWAEPRDGRRKKKWPHREMNHNNANTHAHHLRPDIPTDDIPKAQELVLVSTLDFTRNEAIETYQLRWQVESAYYIAKRILGLGKNEGAPHTIAHTQHAILLLHAFLRVIEIKNDRRRVYNKHGTLGKVWTKSSTRRHREACIILAHALSHTQQTPPRPTTIVIREYIYVYNTHTEHNNHTPQHAPT